eukprot:g29368.t1
MAFLLSGTVYVGIRYSPHEATLSLKGYVRGPGFRCSHLVHLTGHGDFVVERISTLSDPCPLGSGHSTDAAMAAEKVVDELGGGKIPAPGGTVENEDAEMGHSHREEEEDEQLADEGSDEGGSIAPSGMGTEDHWDVSSNMTMEVPTSEVIAAEKRRREVLLQRSEQELEFPDEVDTPLEVPARERFQRYRGLKSFRTSSWDPYEDLPVEYSRIWEFEAFASTAVASDGRS